MKRSSLPIIEFSFSWKISILTENFQRKVNGGLLKTFNESAGWRRDLAGAAGLALAFDPMQTAAS
jgi:hypothetical protein